MIPQHLIDKAAEASLGMPLSAMHPVDAAYARADARAALEAVAADIWDEGEGSVEMSNEDWEPRLKYESNPYRASETA